MATYLPIFKLRTGLYLIGTRVRHLELKENECFVVTSQESFTLKQYLNTYSIAECNKLSILIQNGDGTIKNTVIELLAKLKVDNNMI